MRDSNLAFMKLRRRAEAADPAMLVTTFVDAGPLFTRLSSVDHQILAGRRGTGKTHALAYLDAQVKGRGDVTVFVDMRSLGSTGGIYADTHIPIPERGTRLLCDTLAKIHDGLMDAVLAMAEGTDVDAALALLDRLGENITDVVVVGETEAEEVQTEDQTESSGAGVEVGLDVTGPRAMMRLGDDRAASRHGGRRLRQSGTAQHRVHFGAVSQTLERLMEVLPIQRLWILLDEWSEVPLDLQPLLADLIRRALFPVRGLTVKVGAIEQRSNFQIPADGGGRLGLEVGADAAADVELDDFMVFGNDAEAAKAFFQELLFRHVRSVQDEEGDVNGWPASAGDLVRQAFTQRNAFDEFVRAAEGVPRDAINVLMIAAERAGDDVIGVDHVRRAARDWYTRDKEKAVQSNPQARALLHWIIDKVIGERRARAFLLEQGEAHRHPLIGALYDARVIHLIKRGVATHDRPGVRYDVYGLDYGCYVELMTTARAPQGLFEVDSGGGDAFVEVPTEDYRSIRRAILDLDEFEQVHPADPEQAP